MVGKGQAMKSNLHNFRYRCLVVAVIDVFVFLVQTLHACMNYKRKEKPKRTTSKSEGASTTD